MVRCQCLQWGKYVGQNQEFYIRLQPSGELKFETQEAYFFQSDIFFPPREIPTQWITDVALDKTRQFRIGTNALKTFDLGGRRISDAPSLMSRVTY